MQFRDRRLGAKERPGAGWLLGVLGRFLPGFEAFPEAAARGVSLYREKRRNPYIRHEPGQTGIRSQTARRRVPPLPVQKLSSLGIDCCVAGGLKNFVRLPVEIIQLNLTVLGESTRAIPLDHLWLNAMNNLLCFAGRGQ